MRLRTAVVPLLLLPLLSCVSERERRAVSPPGVIERLVPDVIAAGKPFQVQPNGDSALAVLGRGFPGGSRLRFAGRILETTGQGTEMGAIVPPALFAGEGRFPVTVEMPDGRSTNTLVFTVLPSTGPPPVVASLDPPNAAAGAGFNVQSSGESAITVNGRGFLPGAVIVFGGHDLSTEFYGTGHVAALVPPGFVSKAGGREVYVRNPDGRRSNPVVFRIE